MFFICIFSKYSRWSNNFMSNSKPRHHNIIGRKSLIAVAILMAFNGPDAMASSHRTVHASNELKSCPTAEEFKKLSSGEQDKLPTECQKETSIFNNKLVLGGAAAAVVGIGALVAGGSSSGGSGGSSDNSNNNDDNGNENNNNDNDKENNNDNTDKENNNDNTDKENNNDENGNNGKIVPGPGEIGNIISGDGQQVMIKEDTIAAGEGTIGTLITGENTTATITGDTTVLSGGKGTVIDGNNSTVKVDGNVFASGTDSIAVEVKGENSDVHQNGDMWVSGGATGLKISGGSNKVSNTGSVFVQDASSVGLDITGDNAFFTNTGNIYAMDYGTGVQITGNNVQANLDGSIVADAGDNRLSASGVVVNASNSKVTISGNVTVKSDKHTAIADYLEVNGVRVDGDHNRLDISGAINIQQHALNKSSYGEGGLYGVNVLGNSNAINISGGINIDTTYDSAVTGDMLSIGGINVNGSNNHLSLSGKSTFHSIGGTAQGDWTNIVRMSGENNDLILNKDFYLDIAVGKLQSDPLWYDMPMQRFFSTIGGRITSNGDVSGHISGTLFSSQSSGQVINNGKVDLDLTDMTGQLNIISVIQSSGHNTEEGKLAVRSSAQYQQTGRGAVAKIPFMGVGVATAMRSSGTEGKITNDGVINVLGSSTYGMFAGDESQAFNNGTISVDAMRQHTSDRGEFLNEKSLTYDAKSMYRGAAMISRKSATLLNNGDIVVNNAGTGMYADGATAMNRGNITLLADHSDADTMYGMIATNGGVAINSETGIINIDSANGIALYVDDTSTVLNYGKINKKNGVEPRNNPTGNITNYVIGTNSDGTAGKYAGGDIVIGKNVLISTDFTDGTADKAVTFSEVFQGSNISGEQNIASSSVVWNASASKNAEGNVDVTMIKNDYADVVTDSSVNGLAAALDKSYTSNKLFNSLNVSTASSLNKALKQLSGKQAKSLDREKRVLSQRFTMLAENAPVTTENGLSFNVVAKGDRRAEMDNKVTYDMMAVQQDFNAGAGKLSASYGIARLSGKGGNAG
ncbi:hypothetical protein NG99_02960, partial [Erwinia typographi]